jgi:hypothetical protein
MPKGCIGPQPLTVRKKMSATCRNTKRGTWVVKADNKVMIQFRLLGQRYYGGEFYSSVAAAERVAVLRPRLLAYIARAKDPSRIVIERLIKCT